MDCFYSGNNPRNLKLKGLNTSGGISKIDSALIKYLYPGSPAAGGGDVNSSPVSKYQYSGGAISSRGGSPLSSLENMERSPVFGTPLKVEEDVLVMDGILVGSVPGGRSTARSGAYSGGLGSSGKSIYKKEICRAWEDCSNCRFGSKCQFAHGKEELRPSRFLNKNKSEVLHIEKYMSSVSKRRAARHPAPSPALTPEQPDKAATAETAAPQLLTALLEAQDSRDWSPYDDGIEIGMSDSSAHHKSPSREEFNDMIDIVLLGPRMKKRLPAFVEICPE